MDKMDKNKLQAVLRNHKKWLAGEKDDKRANLRGANLQEANLREADLREADLRGANLQEANLQEADLDYTCWPLWCGGLSVHIDDRLSIQLLFHLLQNVQRSPYVSDSIKSVLLKKELVDTANQFHQESVSRIVFEGAKTDVYRGRN